MNFLQKRRIRKGAVSVLRHSHHARSMRGDLMRAADLQKLLSEEAALKKALTDRNYESIERTADNLYTLVGKLAPNRAFSSWRENLEVIVVAVAVAMGFRTYFIQPFKIPTGSMEPTLFGIHSTTGAEPALSDKIPLKFVKWIVTGEWYKEIRITNFGQLSTPCQPARDDPSVYVFYIGNECYRVPGTAIPDDPSICVVYVGDSVSYKVPKDAALNFQPGENVHPGDLLWSGIVTAGDHVFVNKVKWNFQRPKRGQVMVFSTDGIVGLPPQTHYIKRLSGLPNERISINPPNLLVNSTNVTEPRAMRRISNMEPGYAGYSVTGQNSPAMLRQPSDSILLGDSQYLALGDNTMHSFDSRYWGAVPEENLVGPGMFTYWPFSKRWGPIQ